MLNDCLVCKPDQNGQALPMSGNCTQPLSTVELDPTTRAGASCGRCSERDLRYDLGAPLFIETGFTLAR